MVALEEDSRYLLLASTPADVDKGACKDIHNEHTNERDTRRCMQMKQCLGVLALLGRLRGRKENYHKFEPSWVCMVNARPA